MKKPQAAKTRTAAGSDLKREYRFDYSKSRPNRFADTVARDAVVIVLDPDVAAVFNDSTRVNSFLRAAIAAFEGEATTDAG